MTFSDRFGIKKNLINRFTSVALEKDMGLKFENEEFAFQYLSDITGMTVKIAASRNLEKAVARVRFLVSQGKPHAVAIDQSAKEFNETTTDISYVLNPPKKEITWKKPNLENESGEYFENPVTKIFFAKMGYVFSDKSELISFLNRGKLKKLSKLEIRPQTNITTDPSHFKKELEDSDYRKSYDSLERELRTKRKITLEAPILIKFPQTYYGFSGNRRMNLAWRNDLDVKFWLVEAEDIAPKQKSLF